jgi:hypothetical protein
MMRFLCAVGLVFLFACGDDSVGTSGVELGAECVSSDDCDRSDSQVCLTGFQGGYCGLEDCGASDQCPENSACALHPNGRSYCLRTCVENADCNEFRSAGMETECSDKAPFLDDQPDVLACVPRLN